MQARHAKPEREEGEISAKRGRKAEDKDKYLEQRKQKHKLFEQQETLLKNALAKAKMSPPKSIASEMDQIEKLDKKLQNLTKEIKKSNEKDKEEDEKEDDQEKYVQALDDYKYFRGSETSRDVIIEHKIDAKTSKYNVVKSKRAEKLKTDEQYEYYRITLDKQEEL